MFGTRPESERINLNVIINNDVKTYMRIEIKTKHHPTKSLDPDVH